MNLKGDDRSIAECLHPSYAYSIPAYQRSYEWDDNRWQEFIQDVVSVATDDSQLAKPHWLGIMLLSREEILFPTDASIAHFSVIDGQQRIVTILVWLAALIHHAKENGQDVNLDVSKLSKISVQLVDQKALEIVLEDKWLNPENEDLMQQHQILLAYQYFRFILWLGDEFLLNEFPVVIPKWNNSAYLGLNSFWTKFVSSKKWNDTYQSKQNLAESQKLIDATRNKLTVYQLIHDERFDEPKPVIFQTLNGKRTPLDPIDFVRNSLFVKLNTELATDLYRKFWAEPERKLLGLKKSFKANANFLYDFMISKGEKRRQGTISKNKGFEHFSRMTQNLSEKELADVIIGELVPAMHSWPVVVRAENSFTYKGIAVRFSETNLNLLTSIRDMSENPLNPLNLIFVNAKTIGLITDNELQERLELIENFTARKLLSGVPLSPLRAEVMSIMSDIDNKVNLETLKATLKKHWITDNHILKGFENRSFESLSSIAKGAIFRRIERKRSGAGSMWFRISNLEYQIEHIFPIKDSKWKSDIGSDKWKGSYQKMVALRETIGNLTIVYSVHNKKINNERFEMKQKHPLMKGTAAPLRLHDDWISEKKWTEKEISQRSINLIHDALNYWKEFD